MFRIESVEIVRISSGSKAVAELLSLEPIVAEHIKTKAGTAELVRCLLTGTKCLAYFLLRWFLRCSNMVFI